MMVGIGGLHLDVEEGQSCINHLLAFQLFIVGLTRAFEVVAEYLVS